MSEEEFWVTQIKTFLAFAFLGLMLATHCYTIDIQADLCKPTSTKTEVNR